MGTKRLRVRQNKQVITDLSFERYKRTIQVSSNKNVDVSQF